jgi:hypothetical protein
MTSLRACQTLCRRYLWDRPSGASLLAVEVFPLATSYPASQAFGFSKEFSSPSLKAFFCNRMRASARLQGNKAGERFPASREAGWHERSPCLKNQKRNK